MQRLEETGFSAKTLSILLKQSAKMKTFALPKIILAAPDKTSFLANKNGIQLEKQTKEKSLQHGYSPWSDCRFRAILNLIEARTAHATKFLFDYMTYSFKKTLNLSFFFTSSDYLKNRKCPYIDQRQFKLSTL